MFMVQNYADNQYKKKSAKGGVQISNIKVIF